MVKPFHLSPLILMIFCFSAISCAIVSPVKTINSKEYREDCQFDRFGRYRGEFSSLRYSVVINEVTVQLANQYSSIEAGRSAEYSLAFLLLDDKEINDITEIFGGLFPERLPLLSEALCVSRITHADHELWLVPGRNGSLVVFESASNDPPAVFTLTLGSS